MPPPKPSTEVRDPHTGHEIAQLLRALPATGPQTPDGLAGLVGARFWEVGRFERAVALALSDGLVARTSEGRLSAIERAEVVEHSAKRFERGTLRTTPV